LPADLESSLGLAALLDPPASFEAPPGLAPITTMPADFEAPPGLAALALGEGSAESEAPPGLAVAETKETGFLGWCRRLRMSRFKEACESLL
jgi:hypothetical protein